MAGTGLFASFVLLRLNELNPPMPLPPVALPPEPPEKGAAEYRCVNLLPTRRAVLSTNDAVLSMRWVTRPSVLATRSMPLPMLLARPAAAAAVMRLASSPRQLRPMHPRRRLGAWVSAPGGPEACHAMPEATCCAFYSQQRPWIADGMARWVMHRRGQGLRAENL